ncbi:amidohydrolase family protein [Rhodoplanes roseus]|nr:amidohydrolase family protein [Rhodoplanes roseus]
MARSFVLKGAFVYDHGGDTDAPAVADVFVRDGRIVSVGDPVPPGVHEVIDLSGHLLAPGFVNSHYHSHDVLAKGMFETMSLERWGMIAGPIGSDRSIEEVRLRTILGAVECARNGITTVQDFLNLAPMDPAYVDAIVDAYATVGVRVILSIAVRDKSQLDTILWADEMVPHEHHATVGTATGDPARQLAFVEEQIARIGDRDGAVVWALSPSAPQRCSFELLRGVGDLAKAGGLPVYTHVYETRLQRLLGKERYTDHAGSLIALMDDAGLLGPHVTIAHGVWPDAEEIARIADTGTGVVLNMLSNLKLRSGVAPLAAYRRAGIPLSLGCDNCSCADVQSMLQVMKLYCLLGGIGIVGPERPEAAEAIRLATLGGARAAGREGVLGAVAPGMAADLVAYDLDDPAWRPFNSAARQLVFAETGRAIRHVWVAGRQVVRDGRCATYDESKLTRDLAAAMPMVRRDLDALASAADVIEPAFQAIQSRAFSTELGYDRYLPRF